MRFFASAKINLMLHVTGRRADGYHTLQSAMALCDIGDVLHVEPADSYALRVEGPFAAHAPSGEANLITRAVRAMEHRIGRKAGMDVRLRKNVPAGAGLGGGSADAAAAMHALNALWGQPFGMDDLCALGLTLGAEMPFMLRAKPARVEGSGEQLSPLGLSAMPAVVVWPSVSLATADVFRAYAQSGQDFSQGMLLPDMVDASWAMQQRNDLLAAALQLAPAIGDALEVLVACEGCVFSRMTGSGSAVFGAFETMDGAMAAAQKITGTNPDYWVRACMINPNQ